MSRFKSDEQVIIASLKKGHAGKPMVFREEARQILVELTHQDFGYDTDLWVQWLDNHKYPSREWRSTVYKILNDRKTLLISYRFSNSEATPNPTRTDLETAVSNLDGITSYGMSLRNKIGMLSIWGGKDERVLVIFQGEDKTEYLAFQAKLLDSNVSDPDKEIAFLINDVETSVPRRETVSKITATQIALFFNEYNRLPKELNWTNDISAFT
jgi:hypothetical protein